MKFIPCFLVLLTVSMLNASALDVAGTWRATVVGGLRTKTIYQALLEFKVDGDRLTGTAHIGNDDHSYYPGTSLISDGKIDGDRVSFTVIGEHAASSGVPIMKFFGILRGDQLELTMSLSDTHLGGTMEMKGEKISK